MELLIPIAVFAFKCGVHLIWKLQRQQELKKLKDVDVADRKFRDLILTELDIVNLNLKKDAGKDLKSSVTFYKKGLAQINHLLNMESIGKEDTETTRAAKETDCIGKPTFCTNKADAALTEVPKLPEQAGLDETATKTLKEAKKNFEKASDMATLALNNEVLGTSQRVQAASICVMGIILENMEDRSIALPSCKPLLQDLHTIKDIQKTFGLVVTDKSKKFDDKQIEIFVGVCHLNRVIYDVTQLVGKQRGPWYWPCITSFNKEGKIIHQIDPLRDARVAEALSELQTKKGETLPTSIADLPVAWSFYTAGDKKLISPQGIATNTKGQFIIADDGDRKIKMFDEGGPFRDSFPPLSRRLTDEDILSVTSDREDNLFVLIKVDKYHYKLYLFDEDGKLFHRFTLREGFVRCSPIINDKNEVLVVIEGKDPNVSAVEVYKADGEFVKTFGQGILKEPKDMTAADKGHLMVLNSDGKVVVFDAEGNHLPELDFAHVDEAPCEAIAFHSESKHVVVSNLNISRRGRRAKMSIYNEYRDCVHSIHQGEERTEEEKECVPPKVAVTKDGRIAILVGTVGESNVIVV